MSTISKERLEQLASGNAWVCVQDDEAAELARIALASLEAEPVGTFKKGPCGYHPSFHEDAVPLYTAPPAPVYVPAAMEMDDDFDSSFEHGKAVGWNAYRAAMLQGAEPAQEWIPCSERMPEQFKAILVFNEYGEVWSGAYDRFWNFFCDNELVECVTHWMPLPAAPQQEDDNG